MKRLSTYVLLWGAVIFLSLSGSYFNSVLLDAPFHLRQELPFMARWLVWIPLTPLALPLARKMNYAESSAARFALYHCCIYLVLCAVHVFSASLVSMGIDVLLHLPAVYATILRKCAITGLFYDFIVYGFVLLYINVALYYRALQQERIKIVALEKSLTDSRLLFLKQQLQPHFLFNTHHSIITLIKMGEREKAAGMLEKLSGLMRVALREVEEQKIPLRRELETLELYVDIQKTRFADKMSVEYRVAEDALAALLPSMLLQPLVENAVKYAVEQSAAPCSIVIAARAAGGRLLVEIEDSGSGKLPVRGIRKGTGLTNTEERLRQLYGPESSFAIKLPGQTSLGGMMVAISMPLEFEAGCQLPQRQHSEAIA